MIPPRQRRPRNVVSRHRGMALRCAELLDEGLTDREAADALKAEFAGKGATAAAVAAFRKGTYHEVQDARERNLDAARTTELVLESARGSGALFAQAGMTALAKMLFDAIRQKPQEIDAVKIGRLLAAFVKVENQTKARQMLEERARQADELKNKLSGGKLTDQQLVSEVDRIMGIRKREAA